MYVVQRNTESPAHCGGILEVLLELLDLPADATEQHVPLGEDGAQLAQEDLQDALGGAHHGSLHGRRPGQEFWSRRRQPIIWARYIGCLLITKMIN